MFFFILTNTLQSPYRYCVNYKIILYKRIVINTLFVLRWPSCVLNCCLCAVTSESDNKDEWKKIIFFTLKMKYNRIPQYVINEYLFYNYN